MSKQYPSLMTVVFEGDTAVSSVPFSDVAFVWSQLDKLRANKTPSIFEPFSVEGGAISDLSANNTQRQIVVSYSPRESRRFQPVNAQTGPRTTD